MEVIANGLAIWNGSQLAVDTALVSPLTSTRGPRRRGGRYAGAALQDARKSKERVYPEFRRSSRCRLVVLAIEVGGRWSHEAAQFLSLLARNKARDAPSALRPSFTTALLARWTALLTHAAMQAFASYLLSLPASDYPNTEVIAPTGQLLAHYPEPSTNPSRRPDWMCFFRFSFDFLVDLRSGFAAVAAVGRALHLERNALQKKVREKKNCTYRTIRMIHACPPETPMNVRAAILMPVLVTFGAGWTKLSDEVYGIKTTRPRYVDTTLTPSDQMMWYRTLLVELVDGIAMLLNMHSKLPTFQSASVLKTIDKRVGPCTS